MLTTLLIATLGNQTLPSYTYRNPNILIVAPTLKEESYTPLALLILSLPSGGSEIVVNAAARNPSGKGKSL
jgi:hypothetical protein